MQNIEKHQNSLEEVLLAVYIPRPRETLVRQRRLAVGALETLGVPVSVQHLEDELIQDVLAAARTLRDLCRGQRDGGHGVKLAVLNIEHRQTVKCFVLF